MKRQNWTQIFAGIVAAAGMFSVQAAFAATSSPYTTSTSAVFTQVQGPGSFGQGWKDPSGAIWSTYQGDFANNAVNLTATPDLKGVIMDSLATEACAKIGGSLPANQDYTKLASYFDLDSNQLLTAQGQKDLYAIFSDMQGRLFWSSTVDSFYSGAAEIFSGDGGDISFIFDVRTNSHSVRCVIH